MIEWLISPQFVVGAVLPVLGTVSVATGKWIYNTHSTVKEHSRIIGDVAKQIAEHRQEMTGKAEKLERKLDDLTDFLLREMPRK